MSYQLGIGIRIRYPGSRPLSGMVAQDHASSWSSWAGIGCPAQDDLPGSCYGPALYKPGL